MASHTTQSLQSLLSSLLPDAINYQITWTSQADPTSGMLTLTVFSATHKRTLHYYTGDLSDKAKSGISEKLLVIVAALCTMNATMSATTELSAAESPAAGSRRARPDKTTGNGKTPLAESTGLFGHIPEGDNG